MALPFTTNNIRAQRIAKLALLQSRQQTTITVPCNLTALKFRAGDTVMITGVESHICIYQTVLGALRSGFRPWIVSDAVSSRNSRHHKEAIALFHSSGICAGPAEMAIYQLLERAGTEEFRAMLKHVK
jgi:isochorismate hydrolase